MHFLMASSCKASPVPLQNCVQLTHARSSKSLSSELPVVDTGLHDTDQGKDGRESDHYPLLTANVLFKFSDSFFCVVGLGVVVSVCLLAAWVIVTMRSVLGLIF